MMARDRPLCALALVLPVLLGLLEAGPGAEAAAIIPGREVGRPPSL